MAGKQPDGAERADASNSDRFESYILEHVPLEQTQPFWRKTLFVGCKNALGIDTMPRVALSREMIDHRRLVGDANLFTRYQTWKVVILFESFTGLGEDGMELSSQPAILDMLDLAR